MAAERKGWLWREFRPEPLPGRSWSAGLRWATIPLADPYPGPWLRAWAGGGIQVASAPAGDAQPALSIWNPWHLFLSLSSGSG